MKNIWWLAVIVAVLMAGNPLTVSHGDEAAEKRERQVVVLLHGLGRTSKSMAGLAHDLQAAGYKVINLDYPSRRMTVKDIAEKRLAPVVDPLVKGGGKVHFVTHSLGGVIVRQYLQTRPNGCSGKVVMLAPPNNGSEIIDVLGDSSLFARIMGPASLSLSTAAESLPATLGPVSCPVGVIAGDVSFNLLSSHWIEGKDDGKVSVESTRVDGMADHLVVHASHTFLMNRQDVFVQTLAFLENGRFNDDKE